MSKSLITTQQVKNLVKSKGGHLKKNFKYIMDTTIFRIKCKAGHYFKLRWKSLRQGHWCIKCANERKRKNIENRLTKIIKKKEAVLPKNFRYENSQLKFIIICKRGHRWNTNWAAIRANHWCPKCVGYPRLTTEEAITIIKKEGWKVEKTFKFVNIKQRFYIMCPKKHKFESCLIYIKKGQVCPFCEKIKDEKEILKLIKRKHGKVDDNFKFIDLEEKFWITCKRGHRWKTCGTHLKQDNWCHECFFFEKRKDEKEIRRVIKKRGGAIEKYFKYVGCYNKFWIVNCGKGHRFETNWSLIQRKHWCPFCQAKIQDEFRKIIEKYFGESFPKKRPKWLLWKMGRQLELDGYCENLKIAFEYQGYQHYERAHYDHYSLKEFKKRKKKDAFKIKKCKEKGILLIIVPYYLEKDQWVSKIKKSYNRWKNYEKKNK